MERFKSAMPGSLPEDSLKELAGAIYNANLRREKFQTFAAFADCLLPSLCHLRYLNISVCNDLWLKKAVRIKSCGMTCSLICLFYTIAGTRLQGSYMYQPWLQTAGDAKHFQSSLEGLLKFKGLFWIIHLVDLHFWDQPCGMTEAGLASEYSIMLMLCHSLHISPYKETLCQAFSGYVDTLLWEDSPAS